MNKLITTLIVLLVVLVGCQMPIMPTTRALVEPVDENWVFRVCPSLGCDSYDTPSEERMVAVGVATGESVAGSSLWWVFAVQSRLLYVPINRMALICFEGSCNDD